MLLDSDSSSIPAASCIFYLTDRSLGPSGYHHIAARPAGDIRSQYTASTSTAPIHLPLERPSHLPLQLRTGQTTKRHLCSFPLTEDVSITRFLAYAYVSMYYHTAPTEPKPPHHPPSTARSYITIVAVFDHLKKRRKKETPTPLSQTHHPFPHP